MKHNPFDQGEIRSGELTTASSNNAEMPSVQAPAQEIPAEKTTSEETEDAQLPAEYFLEQHYNFRRNVLSGMVEYKKADEPDEKYARLTSEALNTIYIMGMREMPDVSELKADIKTYVESSIPPVYDPIRQWFDALPQWDGKDRVTDFLNRIPGMNEEQLAFMKTWIRSVTAHWLGIDEEHGNETAPLLIGNQGCGKSTFCLRLLPPSLRQYYLDHFNLANKFDKEMALSGSLLICLDEIDQYKAGQMAELKQALSKVKVNGRRIYGKTIDERKRYASFIATTNNRHPLKDMTGSRRYLTIEIPDGKLIDNQQEIDYEQLYAQLLHEVRDEKMRYWFTNEETLRIQELNIPYQESVDLEAMIDSFYRKPMQGERGSITSLEIRKTLQAEYPHIAISNLSSEKIGMALREMKVKKTRSSKGVAYSLVKRAA